jgi:hypothetical protein
MPRAVALRLRRVRVAVARRIVDRCAETSLHEVPGFSEVARVPCLYFAELSQHIHMTMRCRLLRPARPFAVPDGAGLKSTLCKF